MKSKGYWLSPAGELLDVTYSSHIRAIIDNPCTFGLSQTAVTEAYRKHAEPLGLEGKARRELITQALQAGFIRLRHYPENSPGNGWSVTCYTLDDAARSSLATWAKQECLISPHPEDVAIILTELKTSTQTEYTVADFL